MSHILDSIRSNGSGSYYSTEVFSYFTLAITIFLGASSKLFWSVQNGLEMNKSYLFKYSLFIAITSHQNDSLLYKVVP